MYGAVDSYFDGSQTINRTNDDHALLEELAKFPNWDGTPVMFHFHLMSAHVLGTRNSDNFRFTPAASYALPTGRDGTSGVNFYDNGVLQADGIIHEIQQTLRAKGYLKDALVVVTADHGESLGEHGLYVHTNSVRQAARRIPFLLISHGGPRAQPIDVDRYASQVDIPATVLTDLGVPIPSSWSGVPMQKPTGRAYSPFQERAEVGILDHRDAKVPRKYWMNTDTRAEYVFDLAADPLEESNLVRQVPEELLREWRRQVFKSGQADRVHEAE